MTEQCDIEISVVMPCLNEEKTIGVCIEKVMRALKSMDIGGEVVISDNGSTDRSVEIAESLGARVVHQPVKGYGSAYMMGLTATRGKYIVIGDSDNTYDFSELDHFVTPLRDGYDLVMGNRFKGRILPGAMPWHHKYIGNPILSGILNLFFKTGIGDAHCGFRSFTKEAYKRMRLQTTGMEFASEMVINGSKAGLRITEVPITYSCRAKGTEAKLHSVRDGWRHLRFMLLYSPEWLFMFPGVILLVLGFGALFALVKGPVIIAGLFFDLHYMVLGSLMALIGFQIVSLGLSAKVYSVSEHFEEKSRTINFIARHFNLERGILVGSLMFLAGLSINAYILFVWLMEGFGGQTRLREAILAMTLMVIGLQMVFSSFFMSLLLVQKKS